MESLNLTLPTFSEIAKERTQRAKEEQLRKRDRARTMRRGYQAAGVNRLTADWVMAASTTNMELRRSLRLLRTRARDLARNDDYMRRFLGLMADNIIGDSGIKLQVRVKNDDKTLNSVMNSVVEDSFNRWAHPENASASGRMSWIDIQRYAIRTVVRDGECLIRMIQADNEFGFALDFVDVAWLDEFYNDRLPNGNRVIMSVEVDKYNKPIAYYLTPPRYDYLAFEPRERDRQRVEAKEFIHLFLHDEDEEQTRGIPWAVTAMFRLKMLGGYEDAEVIAARLASCKMGFITQAQADEEGFDYDEEEEVRGDIVDIAAPGVWQVLGPGEDVKAFDPQHPNNNYDMFTKAMVRGAAAGLGVAYVSLSNDLTGVNFSSIRAGLLAERDVYLAIQGYVIEQFCRRVFQAWLPNAFLAEQMEGILARDIQRLKEPSWQGRRWPWVDPVKDTRAKIMQVKSGFTSVTDVLAEQGADVEETFAKIQEERRLAKKYDVTLPAFDGLIDMVEMHSSDEEQPDDTGID